MFRKTWELVGYAYEADLHCLDCAAMRFGLKAYDLDMKATDNEGNPVHPIFLEDVGDSDICGDCLEPLA